MLAPQVVKRVFYPSYVGSDDAYIHLTISKNVAEGAGWAVNPGQPVNASSSPLYFGAIVPSTFHAKTSGVLWVNVVVMTQIAQVIASAMALPLLAAAGIVVRGMRAPAVRQALREDIHLIAFPVALFAFYYLKTPGLQSAARYYLPALFPIPIVAMHLVVTSESIRRGLARVLMIGTLVAHFAVSMTLHHQRVAPTLRDFDAHYGRTMRDVVAYLEGRVRSPRSVVLILVDIGMLGYYGRGKFVIADGGALASPELRHKSVSDMVADTKPEVVVESLSLSAEGDVHRDLPGFAVVWRRAFPSHGIGTVGLTFHTLVYERLPR